MGNFYQKHLDKGRYYYIQIYPKTCNLLEEFIPEEFIQKLMIDIPSF